MCRLKLHIISLFLNKKKNLGIFPDFKNWKWAPKGLLSWNDKKKIFIQNQSFSSQIFTSKIFMKIGWVFRSLEKNNFWPFWGILVLKDNTFRQDWVSTLTKILFFIEESENIVPRWFAGYFVILFKSKIRDEGLRVFIIYNLNILLRISPFPPV